MMKPAIRLAPALLVVALAAPAVGQGIDPNDPSTYPSENIASTPHNINFYLFSNWGVTLPQEQICLPCHVPHNALQSGWENVLWNHEETGVTFDTYFKGVDQPAGVSKKCLSCHDGVTALDAYGGSSGDPTHVITGSAALGSDLSNDHPIGVDYPTNDDQYHPEGSFGGGVGGKDGVHLVDGKVECTSCHEPHNNGLGKFLRAPLIQSYICLQCHNK